MKYLTCCGSCDSWQGVLQREQPSGRAPLPARCHRPRGPAGGRFLPAGWSWYPGHRASTRAHTHRRFHIRELANRWLDGAAHFNVIAWLDDNVPPKTTVFSHLLQNSRVGGFFYFPWKTIKNKVSCCSELHITCKQHNLHSHASLLVRLIEKTCCCPPSPHLCKK